MVIQLNGVTNHGWTFTDMRISQLLDFMYWVEHQDSSKIYTYRDLQEAVEKSWTPIDKSKLRMFFPFLRELGFIIDYRNIKEFNLENLFTKNGKIFLDYILPLYSKRTSLSFEEAKLVERLFSLFLLDGYLNLIKEESKPIYRILLEVLVRKKQITTEDFWIITDSVYNDDLNVDSILTRINEFDFSQEYKVISNINAYGYIIPFLFQCNLVYGDEILIFNKDIYKYLGV